jgi:hypothetical protein
LTIADDTTATAPEAGHKEHVMNIRNAFAFVLVIAAAVSATGCGHLMMMAHGTRVARPAAIEFGIGPRASAARRFTATLAPDQPLRPRRLQTVRVAIADATGRPVDDARIDIDGGMPQHGHGLPTRPRVTRALGDGLYEIEGVRFNMGGWWEFKLAISAATGADVVTFNLDL